MSRLGRTFLLSALALSLAAVQASAQRGPTYRPPILGPTVAPNPIIGPNGLRLQQAAFNTAVMGQAFSQVPPYALGYNPYAQIAYPTVPSLPIGGGVNPYALSTLGGGYNPYTGGVGSLGASSPYSLSTSPGVGVGGSLVPSYGGFGGPIYDPSTGAFMGAAALTGAAGRYNVDIQQARLSRQQVIQSSYDTIRRRIELERWIEANRPTTQQILDRDTAAVLDHVRKDASDVEVNSGKALNALLASLQKSGELNKAKSAELDADTLKHINLTGGNSAGNVGMLKDVAKLSWPDALTTAGFDESRVKLKDNLVSAVGNLKQKNPVAESTLKDIRSDYKALSDKLDDSADTLSPAEYIEARRFLNGMNQAVKALSDKNVGRYFDTKWSPQGKNVAELVDHMSKEGLTFAQAAPGDQAAYKALYLMLRQFEAGVASASQK